MSLNAFAVAFLVPPLSLLPVAIVGASVVLRHPRFGLTLLTISLGGLLVLGMPFVADRLLVSLETGLPLDPPLDDPPQAIVVLTADWAHSEDSPLLDMGMVALERAKAAAVLYRRVKLPILVSGGVMIPGDESLAAAMSRSLEQDFATPVRWLEPRSIDTLQNAAFSATILRKEGVRSVYLVSHAWHLRRGVIAFANTGIAVTAAPVRLDAPAKGRWYDFVPHAESWLTSYFALHEWIGLAYYAMFQ